MTVAPETEPPPLVTANVTDSPAMGDPRWSVTTTEGDGVMTAPATPLMEVDVFGESVVATGSAVPSPLQPIKPNRRNGMVSRVALRKKLFKNGPPECAEREIEQTRERQS
jgi:hypothetical protein